MRILILWKNYIKKIKRKVKTRKSDYVIITRKLRRYIKELKNQNKITQDSYLDLRKKIRARTFKNKAHLREHLETKAQ
jgi:ribosomal protein L19E